MPRDFSKFDKAKTLLSGRWIKVSVYDIKELEDLVFEGFKVYIYGLINKGYNVYIRIEKEFKKIKNFYITFKITKDFENKKLKNTLEKFLESD